MILVVLAVVAIVQISEVHSKALKCFDQISCLCINESGWMREFDWAFINLTTRFYRALLLCICLDPGLGDG